MKVEIHVPDGRLENCDRGHNCVLRTLPGDRIQRTGTVSVLSAEPDMENQIIRIAAVPSFFPTHAANFRISKHCALSHSVVRTQS